MWKMREKGEVVGTFVPLSFSLNQDNDPESPLFPKQSPTPALILSKNSPVCLSFKM